MFWSKLCKLNWNCAWNLAFPVFISPIVWKVCENLHYESVYFKELHNEQNYYWPTIYRRGGGGAAVVSTITGYYYYYYYCCFLYLFFSSLFRLLELVYCSNFKIWYWRFYWSISAKDPADSHWFVVVVLPSQVSLIGGCLWEVVAYGWWSQVEVLLYKRCLL